MTIHIEICKSSWKDGTWNIRIGDIEGSEDTSNITRDEMIQLIKDEIMKR
jgi:hypothetical protein